MEKELLQENPKTKKRKWKMGKGRGKTNMKMEKGLLQENRKTKNVGTWGPGASMWLRFSFFEIFFSKFVKREKLAHFWHGYLFLRVNE